MSSKSSRDVVYCSILILTPALPRDDDDDDAVLDDAIFLLLDLPACLNLVLSMSSRGEASPLWSRLQLASLIWIPEW